MNTVERFFTLIWLTLCLFNISLIQESGAELETFEDVCNNSSTVYLRNYGILKTKIYEPVDCEIILETKYTYNMVISFSEYNLLRDDILEFTDDDGTQLSLSRRGKYKDEERSFLFRGPVKIHFARTNTSINLPTNFQFVFTQTHDYVCNVNEFDCSNKQCIPQNLVCDKHNNCGDGSDERDCRLFCSTDEFRCVNKRCIPKYKLCDGDDDCGDASDEKNCSSFCSSDQFKCENNKRCVWKYNLCDGHDDCGDMSDEKDCGHFCSSDEFMCDNNKCIPKYKLCDYHDDCGDMSDEKNCSNDVCGFRQFRCKNGECVMKNEVCDGKNNCGDWSDEADCYRKCFSSEFECFNRKCIPKSFVCDDHNDCGDMSDERDCRDENKAYEDNRPVLPLTSNPWLITIIVCAAILAVVVITFAAVLIKRRVSGKKKAPDAQLPTVSGNIGVQHVQPPNVFGRIRQSFRSGRQSALSTHPPPPQRQPPVVDMQNYEVPSMYPRLQTGIDNPEFRAEE